MTYQRAVSGSVQLVGSWVVRWYLCSDAPGALLCPSSLVGWALYRFPTDRYPALSGVDRVAGWGALVEGFDGAIRHGRSL